MTNKSKDQEIHIQRVYDAPVKAVWDAWNEPQQVVQWWGPRGFTLTHHSKELRPGGIWHYTMHGPDGTDYENKILYLEVQDHERLVYDHGGNDEQAPLFRVTVRFREEDGKTHLDLTMSLPSAEAAEQTRRLVKEVGGESTWDRLGEFLGLRIGGKDLFIINRSFNVPVAAMFDLWTNAAHLSSWLPPTGFSMEFLRADIHAGGSTFYRMSNGSGVTLFGRSRYLTLQRPNQIVYTQQFCDEQDNLARHPLAPTWPATMLNTVALTAEAPDQTRVCIISEPHGNSTAEEVAAFMAARGGMTQGWSGSFDKLDALECRLS